MKRLTNLLTMALFLWAASASYGQQVENREVRSFHRVKAAGLAHVHLQEGSTESLRVEVKGVNLKDVITQVDDGILVVKTEGNYNNEDIQVYVTYKQITSISVSGASKLYGKSLIKSNALHVSTSDAGDAFLQVDVDSLSITMEGAGNLTIAGTAKSEKISTADLEQGTLDRTGLVTSK